MGLRMAVRLHRHSGRAEKVAAKGGGEKSNDKRGYDRDYTDSRVLLRFGGTNDDTCGAVRQRIGSKEEQSPKNAAGSHRARSSAVGQGHRRSSARESAGACAPGRTD